MENTNEGSKEVKKSFWDFKIAERRWSSIIVSVLIGGLFIRLLYWGWLTFNDYYCLKCLIPTLILSSTVGISLVAIINEIIHFVLTIKK